MSLNKSFIPFFLIIAFIGCGEFIVSGMPDNAFVFLDEKSNTYYAPPCVMEKGYNNEDRIYDFALLAGLKVIRAKDIRIDKFTPDEKCRDASGFIEEKGLFSKERWKEDGTWNY